MELNIFFILEMERARHKNVDHLKKYLSIEMTLNDVVKVKSQVPIGELEKIPSP